MRSSSFFKSYPKSKLFFVLGLACYGTSHIFAADSSRKNQKKGFPQKIFSSSKPKLI